MPVITRSQSKRANITDAQEHATSPFRNEDMKVFSQQIIYSLKTYQNLLKTYQNKAGTIDRTATIIDRFIFYGKRTDKLHIATTVDIFETCNNNMPLLLSIIENYNVRWLSVASTLYLRLFKLLKEIQLEHDIICNSDTNIFDRFKEESMKIRKSFKPFFQKHKKGSLLYNTCYQINPTTTILSYRNIATAMRMERSFEKEEEDEKEEEEEEKTFDTAQATYISGRPGRPKRNIPRVNYRNL